MGLIGAALGFAGCGEDSQTWRQKLRVVVSTPSGDVAGEAVSEGFIKVLSGAEKLGSGNYVGGSITHGEATVVDLGQGRYLFALLGPADDTWYLPFYTFIEGFPNGYPNDERKNYVDAARDFIKIVGPREVPRNKYPLLVTFTDTLDPKTVREVKPADVSGVFGAGYSLKSITLEIVSEINTTGKVQSVLNWLEVEASLNSFWKSLLANGYHSNGSVEVKRFLVVGG